MLEKINNCWKYDPPLIPHHQIVKNNSVPCTVFTVMHRTNVLVLGFMWVMNWLQGTIAYTLHNVLGVPCQIRVPSESSHLYYCCFENTTYLLTTMVCPIIFLQHYFALAFLKILMKWWSIITRNTHWDRLTYSVRILAI